ncbi:MAG: response regulator [Kofleriaceae bacterium]
MTSSHDPDDSGGTEKRRTPRAPVTLLVEYEGADDFLGDYTENLSTGGIFVGTTRAMEIGAPIRLVLSFPGLVEPIAVEGVVRWTRRGAADPTAPEAEPGIGIEFVPGPSRDRLAVMFERIAARDPKAVVRQVRVLVVEDNPLVSSLIQDGLRGATRRSFGELAFQFRTADNGRDALELLAREPFDAMIVDVYLPVVDGPTVIAKTRGELGLTRLPIIAVSAGGATARAAALDAGASMFLDKPMRLRQIIETMRALLTT